MKKSLTVGEFKARFSDVLSMVEEGATIEVTYGRKRKTVAVLSPPRTARPRKLGKLKGRVKASFSRDWKISEEEFLGS
ncbi:prevent-host-death protein [Puniceicoccales bacterium CK1056]|uniref:Prevent-host-death protein n=1 Tax=Oceanipulchritudo coccoides TaxID=2706888 RepID=A0A6B2M4N4_9BACT|nr:prevent-host-death protein [Oceanipulchritudo coccoides]NDV63316.1 prevent-host-death protein [Oceanipulchritudo coccoides]